MSNENKLTFDILEGEYFYGGATRHGCRMPFGKHSRYRADLRKSSAGNQAVPFYLSTKGRYIWSDAPFLIKVKNGVVKCCGEGEITITNAGSTLKDAYMCACKTHFLPQSGIPDEVFFKTPQFNTWIELLYNHNQKDIIKYAEKMLDDGFTPGILMIDDSWQTDYGVWEFSPDRFEDPKQMINMLHEMGFKVMLWIVPYLSKNSRFYQEIYDDNTRLLRKKNGKPLMIKWWNGTSAALDLRKPADREFLTNSLDKLMQEYGVDGFKFDGGNIKEYVKAGLSSKDAFELNQAYFVFSAEYAFCEAKDTVGLAELPIPQRLRDKWHSWKINGINTIIPDAINASLLGYRFLCPDMVGGGDYLDFKRRMKVDEELVVRFAECSSLFPMLQFSIDLKRVLSKDNFDKVIKLSQLHESFGDYIYERAKESSKSGEPIIRPLCYFDAEGGFETITDEFMLGDEILVAPILKKGKTRREIALPKGQWQYIDGTIYEGRQMMTVKAEIGTVPYFMKMK